MSAVREARMLLRKWDDANRDKEKSLEYNKAMKVYFYSPFIFGECHITGFSWIVEIHSMLITNVKGDISFNQRTKYMSQLEMLEKAFHVVWGTVKSTCREDEGIEVMAKLVEFCDIIENDLITLDDVLSLAEKVPIVMSMWRKMKNSPLAKNLLVLCIKYFFELVDRIVNKKRNPLRELRDFTKKTVKKIDDLKLKGNNLFQNNRYKKAARYYSQALNMDVYNAVLYCNRAQANLYLGKNWDAFLDAKRATILNPGWPKAYYRMSQALFEMDNLNKAITQNETGQSICRLFQQDTKDLEVQLSRFQSEKDRLRSMERSCYDLPEDLETVDIADADSDSEDDDEDFRPILEDPYMLVKEGSKYLRLDKFEGPEGRVVKKLESHAAKQEKEDIKRQKEMKLLEEIERKKEMVREKKQKEVEERRQAEKQKEMERKEKEKQKARQESRRALAMERKGILRDGSTAYLEGRGRVAFEHYQKVADLVAQSKDKFGGFTEGDLVIFLYSHAMAALETGNPELYQFAMDTFDGILKKHTKIRTALPYYGKALTYFKMNRFKEAFDPIEKGTFIAEKFPSSVETWPGTSINIQQTEAGSMVRALAELKELCKNPPPPEAYCRYQHCDTRQEIYVSDVEFKGYVKVHCSDHCKMDYHPNCWKRCREEAHRKTDKDMLDTKCFTPDCPGSLVEIIIFGSDGLEMSKITKKELQHEKTKTKTTSKTTKKENKKSKKGKHKEKGQGDSSHQDQENTVTSEPVVEPPSPSPPPAADAVGNSEGTEVTMPGESQSAEGKEIHFEDVTDAAHLTQEPAYILKKDEPEPEDKKQALKSSKSKNKKKKKEQPVTLDVGIDFMDREDRHLISAEDATDETSFYTAAYQQTPVIMGGDLEYHQKQQLLILSEDEKSQVLVILLHFLEILETNGPLKVDDTILTGEVEKLPPDSRELIARHGGLAPFLMVSEEITMVENYVCRLSDVVKCNNLLQRKEVIWTQLPKTETQRQGPYSLGPATWQKPYYLSDGNNTSSVKQLRMNCLDSFGDFSVSDVEDVSDGVLSNCVSHNDDMFLSETDSSSPEVYGDMHLVDSGLVLTQQEGELDNLDLLAKLPPAKLPAQHQQDLSENNICGRNLSEDYRSLHEEETVQAEFETGLRFQQNFDGKGNFSNLSAEYSNKGTGDSSPSEIHQQVLKSEKNVVISGENLTTSESKLETSPVEMTVTNIPKGEPFDSSQRCHSGEVGSAESISSGISVCGDTDMVVDRLNLWKKSVRQVLSLFPEIILEKGEEDDILIRALTQQFYHHVKQLQAGKDREMLDGKASSVAVGSQAVVDIASKAVNTVPLKTFEYEFHEAKIRCDNLQLSLTDTIQKYKSIEEMLRMEQNKTKMNHLQQQGIIEDLQRKLHHSEEKLNQEIRSSQAEKSSLLAMVHEQEGAVKGMQAKLQEFEKLKASLEQTIAEKEALGRVNQDLKNRAEQNGEECRVQRERAKKSEISIIQIHKDQAIRPLDEAARECNYHIMNLKGIMKRNPESTDINLFLKDWERCLEDNKQKLEKTKQQFDGQIQQLHEGKMLIDLPVIPRPEPSRSKMVKKQSGPPGWPVFPRQPFHPAPGVNGVPMHGSSGSAPMRPPHPYNAPPPGLVRPSLPPTTAEDTPCTNSSAATTPTSSTPPPATFAIPPARGNLNGLTSEPGSTMLLAPGPVGGMPPPPGIRPLVNPIGTRHAGGFPPGMLSAPQGGMREVQHPTSDTAALLPNKASQPVPDNSHMRSSTGPYNQTSGGVTAEPQGATGPKSSYQRIMDRLSGKFPSYNRIQLTNFLRMVRANNGNSLSGLSMDGITKKVGELIAENEMTGPRHKQHPDGSSNPQQPLMQPPQTTPVVIAPAAPPSKNAWSALDDTSVSWQTEQYDDEVDPCVICHEELVIKDVLDLECGHRFHSDCIQEWLATKSTCPNCRKFTKLKEDYPELTT